MSFIDLILNLAGLLLWLNWRSLRFDPLVRTSAASLAGTLKRAEAPRLRGWQFLAGLAGLLLVRALVYWPVGAAADWKPDLDLAIINLRFRCDRLALHGDDLAAALLYSGLSFLRVMMVFYFWLLALAVLNRRAGETEQLQKIIRLHLGVIGRWPWYIQVALPLLVAAALWAGLHPLLVALDIVGKTQSQVHVLEQGLLVGAGLYLTLKYLLPAFLLLHLVLSYVYLGRNPLWDFVSMTARNVLAPIRWIPLRLGMVDFAPVIGAVLILLLLHVVPVHGPQLLANWLHLNVEPIWPR